MEQNQKKEKNIDKVSLQVAIEIICQMKMEEGISGEEIGRSQEFEVGKFREEGIGSYTI